MADVVATPAAPVQAAPEAPALAAHLIMQPYEVEGSDAGQQPVEGEAQADAEVAPVEKPKPVQRLAEFRNADGTLNEELIEQVATNAKQAGATVAQIQQAYNSDPEYRLNYIQWLQKQGSPLLPEQLAELNASKAKAAPPQPAAPAKPQYTQAQIDKGYNDLQARMNNGDPAITPAVLARYWHTWVTLPHQEAQVARQLAADKAARDAEAEVGRQRSIESAAWNQYTTELKEAHDQFKDLVVPDRTRREGYRIVDADIEREMVAIGGSKPIVWKLQAALRELGRALPPKKLVGKAAAVRPNTAAPSPRQVQPAPKLKPWEIVQPASVAGMDE